MNEVFLIMNKLNWGAGSTRAMMNRSKSLVERGYGANILTLRDTNTKRIEKELKKAGRLNKKVKVYNIYDYYSSKNSSGKITREQRKNYKKLLQVYEKGYQIQNNQAKRYARYFDKGLLIKYKKWNKNGSLRYIDYFSISKKKTYCEVFHEDGYIKKKTYFDPANEKKMHTQHFTNDNFCFLDIWHSKENKSDRYFLFNRKSNEVDYFTNKTKFETHWLTYLCSKEKEKPYIINDKKECAPIVLNMKQNSAYRIYVIHRNHFESPFILGSPYRKQEKRILDNLKELDHLVVLTEKQKEDIIKEFGDYGNISVIPHSVHNISKEKVKKDDKTVSMMARLAPIKQIPYAIETFQQVVEVIPDAKLEIHGSGDLEKTLKKKIKKLHLEKNIFLKGYANNTDAVYKRSLMTILTTKSEAFAMVILESMANGTPVISHDINYGPRDMITDGEDGYLINQDKNHLADKIIELLKNPNRAHKMGEKAIDNTNLKFNEKKVNDNWIQLLKDLKKK